jgi:hypothetical protein
MNGLFSRVPVGRNLFNSDAHDPNANHFNSDGYLAKDPHDAMERLLGRAPTPDEVGARMLNALNTPAAPGYDVEDQKPLMPGTGYWDPTRTLLGQIMGEWSGKGRREENIPELPPYLAIDGQETSAFSDIGDARDDRNKMVQIAAKQLPGSTFRYDTYGNPIITVPQGTQTMEPRVAGVDPRGEIIMERTPVPFSGEYYLNRPGFSQRDAANLAQGAIFKGAGAKLLGLVAGPVGEILGPALGSAAQDIRAGYDGGDFSLDPGHMVSSVASKVGRKALTSTAGKILGL